MYAGYASTIRRCTLGVFGLALVLHASGAQIDAYWTNAAGGTWTTGTNWSSSPAYPNNGANTYNVFIDLLPTNAYTVTLNSNVTIDNFELNSAKATLSHTAGTFRVLGVADLLAGTYSLNGGTIAGGTWNVAPGTFAVTSNVNNRLDGVTFNGDLNLSAASARLNIAHRLTLNGTATLGGSGATLNFEGTQTFDNATLRLDAATTGTKNVTVATGGALTLGMSAVVRGGRGAVYGSGSLTNQGLITADVSGQMLDIATNAFTNQGIMRTASAGTLMVGALNTTWSNAPSGTIESNNSTLTLGGHWSNAGTITAANSTVNLGGVFTTAGLGVFRRTGGTVNVTGRLDNTGSVLNLDDTTGQWRMNGGTILGGVVNLSDPAKLTYSTGTGNLLDGVRLDGPLVLQDSHAAVRLSNTTTISGPITLAGWECALGIDSGKTLDNNTITFDQQPEWWANLSAEGAGTVTFGPNLTIRGAGGGIVSGMFTSGNTTVLNQGRVSADVPGRGISVQPYMFVNEGTTEAVNGAYLYVGRGDSKTTTWTNGPSGLVRARNSEVGLNGNWTNRGTIDVANSTLRLGGSFSLEPGSRIARAGGTVYLEGTLNNAGCTLTLDETTGPWIMNSYSAAIVGGTLDLRQPDKLLINAGALNGVTVNGDLRVQEPYLNADADLRVGSGTVFQGTVTVPTGGALLIDPGVTLDGTTIVFEHPQSSRTPHLEASGAGTWTLGPDLVVRGGYGILGTGGYTDRTLVNRGLISADVGGKSIRCVESTVRNEGTMRAADGGLLEFTSTPVVGVTLANTPSGIITADNGTVEIKDYTPWSNRGTIEAVRSGVVRGRGADLVDLASGVLTGGSWNAYTGSTLDLTGATITTNAADVRLSGPGSTFSAIDSLTNNRGQFTITDGRDFGTLGNLANEGSLRVGKGSTLTVRGSLFQSNAGDLIIDLGGLVPDNDFGLVHLLGQADLAGELSVNLLPGFAPTFGDRFEFLTATSIAGGFSAYEFPTLPGGLFFTVDLRPTSVALSVMPEPAGLLALSAGLCLLRRRRATRQGIMGTTPWAGLRPRQLGLERCVGRPRLQ